MPFRPEPWSYKAVFITQAPRGRRNDKDAHLLTRYYTAHEGCQTDRLADKECEGHSGGRGRHPGSKRWCTVSAHAKSVTISTDVKPRLSAAATSHNPLTIWPNLENKWRVSSYINTQQNPHPTPSLMHQSHKPALQDCCRLRFKVAFVYFLFGSGIESLMFHSVEER